MWIVRVALDRPYTFIVLALLILILSPVVILRTPTDIFPNINIPVIAVAWQFTGLNPEELEGRITTGFERVLTTTVDNIEHIESTTVSGQSIVRIFLQPNAHLDTANAQVTAVSQTQLAWFAPGTALHWIVAVVPSWSWIETVPVVDPFIFSLKVTVKASPVSTKSVLGPALFDIRASIIVGGVKSAAPVVKVVQAVQFARSLPAM